MKKVLILSNDHAYTYDLRKEIIEELLKNYEVCIAVPYGEKMALLEEMGCKHAQVELEKRGTNPLADFKLFRSYLSIMKSYKPDVVLTYTIKPNVYGGFAASLRGIPYLANITGLGTAIEHEGIMQKFTILLHRIGFRKINCVFFQNSENKKFFEDRKICKAQYRLLPGSGVNTKDYVYLEYPSDDKCVEFLFISRIMKEKGIEEYLYAAEQIKEKYPNTVFHILGNCNEEYEDIVKQAHDKGIVNYHGRTNDVMPFIKNCHCLIHPSYYPEGMSNVCLEAASCGRPVITTNRSGCRETVDDRKTGYVVAIKDKEQLVNAIEQFIKLPYEEKVEMGKEGRKKMQETFDRSNVVAAYMEEIERNI